MIKLNITKNDDRLVHHTTLFCHFFFKEKITIFNYIKTANTIQV